MKYKAYTILQLLTAYNDLTHNEISTRAIDLLKKRENGEIRLDNGLTAALIKLMYTDSIWWKMKLVEATSDTLNESIGDTMERVKGKVRLFLGIFRVPDRILMEHIYPIRS